MTMIAVDTGGTFTDVVCLRDGSLRTLKVPSTPDDPAQAVLTGIAEVLNTSADRFVLVHGSTVATNTLLERKGAVVALVTNAGFEDVLEIGRQNRPQLYALVGHRPPPLVPRERRHGIRGRLGPVGEELEPLDTKALASLAERLGDAESIAICMLHSYANPAHELEVARGLERLGVPVSLSSEILPEFREYERTATTVVNAYVAPVTDRYLGRLAAESKAERVRIMASSGGVMALSRARRDAVHTVLSGPAGGVSGALAVARAAGFRDILTFDMGGTSTDVSLCPGRPLHTREFRIADVPVAIPVLDIHTVGAGGGSIARIDVGGALHVGPESAGARPGPICYGRGGTATYGWVVFRSMYGRTAGSIVRASPGRSHHSRAPWVRLPRRRLRASSRS
jgi:N-methylhydantoinase A